MFSATIFTALFATVAVLASPFEVRQSESCTKAYTVVSGDTCFAIEAKENVSDATLHALNPGINSECTNLQIGEVLCISTNSTSLSCGTTYTVVGGDTCFEIENKEGISDSTLHSLNPSINSDCTNLEVGEVLCIALTCGNKYTVQSGDSCSEIETKENITDATLRALNPSINSDCTNLQIGEVLCLGTVGNSTTTDLTFDGRATV
ncbi:hypothetical protein HMN09_00821500 [Mycena chlorophos]|uniref:LysM domain-containing protein n=1 Tax=Mycena chlorophos TaxID=658473 RepID=A0A8H6SUU3_MYCCL|nr:hypothetical protein HMN09_00821500 [Mycena chlorophos]